MRMEPVPEAHRAAEACGHLMPDEDGLEQSTSVDAVDAGCDGEGGRHDMGGRVPSGELVPLVELQQTGGRAVEERGRLDREAGLTAQRARRS